MQHILFHKAEVRDPDTSSCEMEGQRMSGRRVLQSAPKSMSTGACGSFAILCLLEMYSQQIQHLGFIYLLDLSVKVFCVPLIHCLKVQQNRNVLWIHSMHQFVGLEKRETDGILPNLFLSQFPG